MANQVLDGQVHLTLEPLHFTLHIAARTALGSSQLSTVDGKLAFTYRIDFFVAVAFVRVAIVWVIL